MSLLIQREFDYSVSTAHEHTISYADKYVDNILK